MPAPTSLRARQAATARDTILKTLVEMLEHEDPDQLSIEALAERCGVSRRTIYRYFPTRPDLLAAAAEWIYENRIRIGIEIERAEDLPESFLRSSEEGARSPALARVLLNTETGRQIRNPRRARRAEAIRTALLPLTAHLPEERAAEAIAVITQLCGSRSWVTLQDESDLDAAGARRAVAWVLQTLISSLLDEAEGGRGG